MPNFKLPDSYKNKIAQLIQSLESIRDSKSESTEDDLKVVCMLLDVVKGIQGLISIIEGYSTSTRLIARIMWDKIWNASSIPVLLMSNLNKLDEKTWTPQIKGKKSAKAVALYAEFLDTLSKWKEFYPSNHSPNFFEVMEIDKMIEPYRYNAARVIYISQENSVNGIVSTFMESFTKFLIDKQDSDTADVQYNFLKIDINNLPDKFIHLDNKAKIFTRYSKDEIQKKLVDKHKQLKSEHELSQPIKVAETEIKSTKINASALADHKYKINSGELTEIKVEKALSEPTASSLADLQQPLNVVELKKIKVDADFIKTVIRKLDDQLNSGYEHMAALKARAVEIIRQVAPLMSPEAKEELRDYLKTSYNFIREHQKCPDLRVFVYGNKYGDTDSWQKIDKLLSEKPTRSWCGFFNNSSRVNPAQDSQQEPRAGLKA